MWLGSESWPLKSRDVRASVRHNPVTLRRFHRGNVRRHLVDRPSVSPPRTEPQCPGGVSCEEHHTMRIALGQIMTQTLAGNRRLSLRATGALVLGAALMLSPALLSSASAQMLGYASTPQSLFPSDNLMVAPPAGEGDGSVVPERLRRTIISFNTREAPGTIIIDTGNTALYFVLGQGRAIRYGVGVGREGFTWSGVQTISRKAEWPDWH